MRCRVVMFVLGPPPPERGAGSRSVRPWRSRRPRLQRRTAGPGRTRPRCRTRSVDRQARAWPRRGGRRQVSAAASPQCESLLVEPAGEDLVGRCRTSRGERRHGPEQDLVQALQRRSGPKHSPTSRAWSITPRGAAAIGSSRRGMLGLGCAVELRRFGACLWFHGRRPLLRTRWCWTRSAPGPHSSCLGCG
jgi:hypothetical protein